MYILYSVYILIYSIYTDDTSPPFAPKHVNEAPPPPPPPPTGSRPRCWAAPRAPPRPRPSWTPRWPSRRPRRGRTCRPCSRTYAQARGTAQRECSRRTGQLTSLCGAMGPWSRPTLFPAVKGAGKKERGGRAGKSMACHEMKGEGRARNGKAGDGRQGQDTQLQEIRII